MRKKNVFIILVWANVAMASLTITTEGPNGPVIVDFGEKHEKELMAERVMKWYNSTTWDLIGRLREPNLPNRAKVGIVRALGELRARQATMILIHNINMVSRVPQFTTDLDPWQHRPAIGALVNIGPYASTMIMSIVGSPKFDSAKVDGYAKSSSSRDVGLTLEAMYTLCTDQVKFTVLCLVVTTDHTGSLESDNSVRDNLASLVVPPDPPACYAMGHHLYRRCFPLAPEAAWNGRGSEFMGTVYPSDFVPGEFSGAAFPLHLAREVVNGKAFTGPNGDVLFESYSLTPDNSSPLGRDDNPQSGASQGVIYDADAPGVGHWGQASNTIDRYRINFRAWAEWEGTRCSSKKEWYTRQSYKKTGTEDNGTVTSADASSLTDSGKTWATGLWVPGVVLITSDPGSGQVRRITVSEESKITVATSWITVPTGATYAVMNTSTWTQINDVPSDNKNDDGSTNITWNLE